MMDNLADVSQPHTWSKTLDGRNHIHNVQYQNASQTDVASVQWMCRTVLDIHCKNNASHQHALASDDPTDFYAQTSLDIGCR